MTPRRWAPSTQRWVYLYLIERDGEICRRCHQSPGELYPNNPHACLQIDHRDGNPFNNSPGNLALLCAGCNQAEENERRSGRRHAAPVGNSPSFARVRAEGRPDTRIARQLVDYSDSENSGAMRANSLFELRARSWILSEVRGRGFITREHAIAGAAEFVGCSVSTATRYLAKLLSPVGVLQVSPLEVSEDMFSQPVITFKPAFELPAAPVEIQNGCSGTEANIDEA